jgi:ferredoxin
MSQYFFIFPLITRVLDFVNGESTSEESTIYDSLKKAFINGEDETKEQTRTTVAPFTTGETEEDAECEKCGILLETTQVRVTRARCQCTWCAECVEECFELVEFEMDAPLTELSRSCAFTLNITMRDLVPFVGDMLSEKTKRYVDVMGAIEMAKNDWILDEEVEE